ncbi:T9SS type A sorting domain-containing protein [Flavobacterium sp.]|jgi:hypothetical protein|uniref:T9SS type A sorting domain-containing protein n=1 Tax=Flavobacterium sp. TaxID=239 RepID=UPI0037BE2389
MKRILLTLALTASTFAFSQTLQSENFNGLTIGNIGTDITGATAGQGGFLTASSNGTAPTTSTNAAASNFQIIAAGRNSTNGLQLVSPNGDKGSRIMAKPGLDVAWTGRTATNNIIELEYDFFTGPITDSRTQVGMRILGSELVGTTPTTRTVSGFVYTTNTRVLQGVAYILNGSTYGTFLINLGATPVVLEANTWYTIGCSYNVTTGEATWRTNSTTPPSAMPAANWVPGITPIQVNIQQVVVSANATANPPVPANTVTSTIVFDNYVVRAVETSNLLNTNEFVTIADNAISVYPNPTRDVLNLKVAGSETITAIQVVDLNGRQMISKTFNNVSDAQIDVNDLTAGMYLINITAGEQTVTKKFLKQ